MRRAKLSKNTDELRVARMEFSAIITLCFIFLLCQGLVSSSRHMFSKNQTLSVDYEDITLAKFFDEFNRAYLERNKPRHILVIGGSTEDLRQAQPLFDSYPYMVYTDLETLIYPEVFNAGSYVVVFLDNLTGETSKKRLKSLPGRRNQCYFLFVTKGALRLDEISAFFQSLLTEDPVFVELVLLDRDVVRHYSATLMPNCTWGAESRSVWRPGSDLSSMHYSWIFRLRRWIGCPLKVSTFESLPKMLIGKNPDGSSTIVGGRDGRLVLAIAEKLNFTIALSQLADLDQRHCIGEADVLDEVVCQAADFGISDLRPTSDLMKTIDFSNSYGEECITWGVPLEPSGRSNLIWAEWSWKVWALIGLVFVISCVIEHANHSVCSWSKNGNRRGVGFAAVVLDVVGMNLGHPVIYAPVSIGGRMVLIICLFYSMVITTGYKTALFSILATDYPSPIVNDLGGILDSNLPVGGSQYNLRIINDLVGEDDRMIKLIDRYVLVKEVSGAFERLKNAQGIFYFSRLSTLEYVRHQIAADHELITFDISDRCVLIYPTVMVFPKGSVYLGPINDLISRLRESGIFAHFDSVSYSVDDKVLRDNAQMWSALHMKHKFRKVFIFHSCCITVCLLVFFIELLTARFNSIKRRMMRARGFTLRQN